MDFSEQWSKLLGDCPFVLRHKPAKWVRWMQSTGYERRMHGDLLNKAIVDTMFTDPTFE